MPNNLIRLSKNKFWDRLVDHYFDEVFVGGNVSSINTWLQKQYGAITSYDSRYIDFVDSKQASWFLLKWS